MTFGKGSGTCIGRNISLLEIYKILPSFFLTYTVRHRTFLPIASPSTPTPAGHQSLTIYSSLSKSIQGSPGSSRTLGLYGRRELMYTCAAEYECALMESTEYQPCRWYRTDCMAIAAVSELAETVYVLNPVFKLNESVDAIRIGRVAPYTGTQRLVRSNN